MQNSRQADVVTLPTVCSTETQHFLFGLATVNDAASRSANETYRLRPMVHTLAAYRWTMHPAYM